MTRIQKTLALAALAATLSISTVLPAAAHAQLEKASPPVGGTVTTSPSEIRLTFSEPVEAKLSSIRLTDAAGTPVAAGAVADSADEKALVLKLGQPLPAGSYKVRWKVISVDSHKTEGSFGFTVGH